MEIHPNRHLQRYGLRPSTECVYRDIKSDDWQWHNTRLLDPQRAERMQVSHCSINQMDGNSWWRNRKPISSP